MQYIDSNSVNISGTSVFFFNEDLRLISLTLGQAENYLKQLAHCATCSNKLVSGHGSASCSSHVFDNGSCLEWQGNRRGDYSMRVVSDLVNTGNLSFSLSDAGDIKFGSGSWDDNSLKEKCCLTTAKPGLP